MQKMFKTHCSISLLLIEKSLTMPGNNKFKEKAGASDNIMAATRCLIN